MNVHLTFEPFVSILAQQCERHNSTVVTSGARLEYFVNFKNNTVISYHYVLCLSFQCWIRNYNETTYMSEIALNGIIENNTEMTLSEKQLSFMSFHWLSF